MTLRFKPAAWFDNPQRYTIDPNCVPTVEGRIVYINEDHRYYRVEYQTAPGCIGHECFKF